MLVLKSGMTKVGLLERMLEKYWDKKKAAVKEMLLDVILVDQMDCREAA